MKIGLLTYYGDLNCGTNLQAYATLLALRKVFPNDSVQIIPFHGFAPPGVKPYFTECTIKSLFRDIVRIVKYKNFVKNFLDVSKDFTIKNPIKGLDFIQSLGYDRIYVGADTLLELDRLPSGYDGLSAYWLSPSITAKKYLISASSKNVCYEYLTDNQKRCMNLCVNNYLGIAVRDTPTFKLISNYIDSKRILKVPDPTFTLDVDYSHVESYLKRRKINLERTICFHTLKDDKWASCLARLLKQRGYRIASFRPAKWADIELNDMNPLEQLGVYKFFSCFITHRFHDTIFCLKNLCPVLCYPVCANYSDENGNSKYSDLLDLFGLKDLCFISDRNNIIVQDTLERVIEIMASFNYNVKSIESTCSYLSKSYFQVLEDMK